MVRFPAAPFGSLIPSSLLDFITTLSLPTTPTQGTLVAPLTQEGISPHSARLRPRLISTDTRSHHICAIASSAMEKTALIVVDVQEDFCPPVRLLSHRIWHNWLTKNRTAPSRCKTDEKWHQSSTRSSDYRSGSKSPPKITIPATISRSRANIKMQNPSLRPTRSPIRKQAIQKPLNRSKLRFGQITAFKEPLVASSSRS